jgi:uncharacterized protein YndB with AHSA1/START domain
VADVKAQNLVFRVVINAPIERVWRELTKSGEAQGAIFNAWLHTRGALAPGAAMQMRTGSGKHTLVVGEVLEHDPPRRFVHTHRFTQYDDPVCHVSYDLEPVSGGVQVTLRVSGAAAGTKTAKDMASGGTMIVGTLKSICETGRPAFGTRLMYLMFKYMEFVLPARTKSEHWPL